MAHVTRAAVLALITLLMLAGCASASHASARLTKASDIEAPALTAGVAAPTVDFTQRVLAVPLYHQAHRLSCEAAALRMALAYEGISLDELTLISYMGDDKRPARVDSRGHLIAWGDPMAAFVGNPDGRLAAYTGYGVYYAPVARAATNAGATVLSAGSGLYGAAITPSEVYAAILQGHPVVAWISNTYHSVPLQAYAAFDNAAVRYTLTEHAVTVVGVRPDAVLVNDPWFGQAWRPKAQFESAFRTFDGMAVVIGHA
jgi:uncharacterized protein YvpB